ncbi:MAG: hypothetical protein Q8R28_14190 [Dehalococcoidia bacterium]|nr:hypothetical protein [Dehalococcoidia bacterium]
MSDETLTPEDVANLRAMIPGTLTEEEYAEILDSHEARREAALDALEAERARVESLTDLLKRGKWMAVHATLDGPTLMPEDRQAAGAWCIEVIKALAALPASASALVQQHDEDMARTRLAAYDLGYRSGREEVSEALLRRLEAGDILEQVYGASGLPLHLRQYIKARAPWVGAIELRGASAGEEGRDAGA